MLRRDFLVGGPAAALFGATALAASALDGLPIIDAHMHLFDATRPQGVPYSGSPQFKGGVSLPKAYIAQARSAGIVGAMAMEASNWLEDNLWLMERVESDPFFVGMVGMLDPTRPDFAEYLERFAKNRLFRGIRYGKIWGLDISRNLANPALSNGLKRLAAMGLSLDMANVDIDLLKTTIALSDKFPQLRIVLDHSPSFTPKPQERATYDAALREIGKRPNVFTKLSWNVITREMTDHLVNDRPVPGLGGYKDRIDTLTGTFGEDRVMFCTNYPQTVGPVVTRVDQIARLTKAYYADKPRAVAEKFFWKNALKTYGWVKRAPAQPA